MKHPLAVTWALVLTLLLPSPGQSDAPPLRPQWRVKLVEDDIFLRHRPEERTGPVAAGDGLSVFVATSNGQIRKVSVHDGRTVWSRPLPGGAVGDLVVAHNLLYVAGDNGILLALDPDDGSVAWSQPTGGRLVAGPTLAEGRLLYTNDADKLRALDARTGKWLWDYQREQPDGFLIYGGARPTVRGATVLAGFSDGVLVALALDDGAILWTRGLGKKAAKFNDVDATPLAHGDTIYSASYLGGVYALDVKDGSTRWHVPIEAARDPMVLGSLLLIPTGLGRLVALDRRTGTGVFQLRLSDDGLVGPIRKVSEYLAVSVQDRGVALLRGTDGSIVQWLRGGSGGLTAPVVVGGVAVVLSNGGYLYGYALTRG